MGDKDVPPFSITRVIENETIWKPRFRFACRKIARMAIFREPQILNQEEMKMRTDAIAEILSDLNGSSGDIEASAVVSLDGLMMASLLPSDVDEDRVAAMSAALLALGERTAKELERGHLNQILIQGSNGYVIMTEAGQEAVLTVMTKKEAKLGLVFLDISRAAKELARIL